MFSATITKATANDHAPDYDHTQWSNLYVVLLVPAAGLIVAAPFVESQTDAVGMTLVALLLGTFAYAFRCLRVVDERDRLVLRYGTLPLFRKSIRYADIVSVARDRSSLIDGWGIHWVPWRGWTYNLWGFDCVRLTLAGGRTLRVGTDDPAGLAHFLTSKLGLQH